MCTIFVLYVHFVNVSTTLHLACNKCANIYHLSKYPFLDALASLDFTLVSESVSR